MVPSLHGTSMLRLAGPKDALLENNASEVHQAIVTDTTDYVLNIGNNTCNKPSIATSKLTEPAQVQHARAATLQTNRKARAEHVRPHGNHIECATENKQMQTACVSTTDTTANKEPRAGDTC